MTDTRFPIGPIGCRVELVGQLRSQRGTVNKPEERNGGRASGRYTMRLLDDSESTVKHKTPRQPATLRESRSPAPPPPRARSSPSPDRRLHDLPKPPQEETQRLKRAPPPGVVGFGMPVGAPPGAPASSATPVAATSPIPGVAAFGMPWPLLAWKARLHPARRRSRSAKLQRRRRRSRSPPPSPQPRRRRSRSPRPTYAEATPCSSDRQGAPRASIEQCSTLSAIQARIHAVQHAIAAAAERKRRSPPPPPPSYSFGAHEVRSAGCVLVRQRSSTLVSEALVIRRGNRAACEIPKGRVRGIETLEQAAERELREETGLMSEVEVGPLVSCDQYVLSTGIPKTVHYYIARNHAGGEIFGRREAATKELVWTSLSELPTLAFRAGAQKAVVRSALNWAG